MQIFFTLALYVSSYSTNNFEQFVRNDAYCQNLYWQPNALEKMNDAWCDLGAVEQEINFVKSGRHEQ